MATATLARKPHSIGRNQCCRFLGLGDVDEATLVGILGVFAAFLLIIKSVVPSSSSAECFGSSLTGPRSFPQGSVPDSSPCSLPVVRRDRAKKLPTRSAGHKPSHHRGSGQRHGRHCRGTLLLLLGVASFHRPPPSRLRLASTSRSSRFSFNGRSVTRRARWADHLHD